MHREKREKREKTCLALFFSRALSFFFGGRSEYGLGFGDRMVL